MKCRVWRERVGSWCFANELLQKFATYFFTACLRANLAQLYGEHLVAHCGGNFASLNVDHDTRDRIVIHRAQIDAIAVTRAGSNDEVPRSHNNVCQRPRNAITFAVLHQVFG